MRGGLKQEQSLRERMESLSPGQREVLQRLLQADRRAAAPLSPAQERLWFLEQLSPNSPWYNVDLAFRLELDPGDSFDVDAMRRAVNHIVQRHESLRASFSSSDGQPVQLIHPELTIPFPVYDLTRLPDAQRETEMMRIALEEAQRPFDLSRPPLLRTVLVQLSPESFVFILTVHHIIADGWSLHIFSDELTRVYEAFREFQPAPLPTLAIQFSDYVRHQRRWLQSDEMGRHLAWWKRRLEGALL